MECDGGGSFKAMTHLDFSFYLNCWIDNIERFFFFNESNQLCVWEMDGMAEDMRLRDLLGL